MREHHLNDIILPDYSLRYHKSAVTTSIVVEWPSRSSVPILITGDLSGLIALWDLISRRPITTFTLDYGAQVVAIQALEEGLIAVLSKDHKLRLLRVVLKERESLVKPGLTPDNSWQQVRQIYEIPVNTLNFANFVIQKLSADFYRLICSNTQNSEAIDVYQFHLADLHSLRRLLKGVTFGEVIQRLSNDPESSKAKKLGIVMKFLELKGVIYCGFESGLVVGFTVDSLETEVISVDKTGMSQDLGLRIVYVSSVHYPDPVLDLEFDNVSDQLLSSSTKDLIGVHPVVTNLDTIDPYLSNYYHDNDKTVLMRDDLNIDGTSSKRIPVASIGHLAVVDGNLIAGSWTGITSVLSPACRELARMSKSRSNVSVSDSSQGSLQGTNGESDRKKHAKVTSLTGISSASIRQLLQHDTTPNHNLGQNRRRRAFSEKSWCFIGYDDGSVAVYHIQ